MLFVTGFGVLFLAGARLRYVLAMLRSRRLFGAAGRSFRLPHAPHDRLSRSLGRSLRHGFQLTQSLIAIGRGEWFGVGLGASVQKLFYLPEAHTDFLFAVLAEELGLFGVVLTLALFLGLSGALLDRAPRLGGGLKFQATSPRVSASGSASRRASTSA